MPLHTAALAILVCAGALWLYTRSPSEVTGTRRAVLAALRWALVCSLAIILLNPVVVGGQARPNGKLPFILLLDTSRSMRTPDAEFGQARYDDAAARTVRDTTFLANLRRKYDVRIYGFAEKPLPRDQESLSNLRIPDGKLTSLGAALADSSAGASGGRVLLVSDGRDTAESFPVDAARSLKARGVVVDTVCVGKRIEQTDIELVARKSQVYASPAQVVRIGAEIRQTGIKGATVCVHLLEGGRRLATKTVLVRPGRSEVDFPIVRQQKGSYRLSIAAEPVSGEKNLLNNRANVLLTVMNTQVRVLFLEGRPSWDSKFLAQALRSDPSITLDVVYKLTGSKFFAVLGEGQKQAGVELPKTVDQFSRYDVVMFGKGFEEFYDDNSVRALKQWISERGGNVLFLRGRADERTAQLRDIEPLTWSAQEIDQLRLHLTDEGRSHPGFAFDPREDAQTVVKRMPPLVSATRVEGEKALSVVLARAEDAPDNAAKEMATLAYMRYGQGKSMAIVGQGMWRWAFLPPDMEGYRKVYQEFWSQTIRWMVSDSDFLPGQKVSIRSDRSRYAPGEKVNLLGYLRAKDRGAPPILVTTLPNGARTSIATARSDGKLADFTAVFQPRQAGEYSVSIPNGTDSSAPASCTFVVAASNEEDMNTSADPELMRQIAAAGGGLSLSTRDLPSLPERLSAMQTARQTRPEPRSAWDRPWVLATLLGLAAVEWWLRRRWGLA